MGCVPGGKWRRRGVWRAHATNHTEALLLGAAIADPGGFITEHTTAGTVGVASSAPLCSARPPASRDIPNRQTCQTSSCQTMEHVGESWRGELCYTNLVLTTVGFYFYFYDTDSNGQLLQSLAMILNSF